RRVHPGAHCAGPLACRSDARGAELVRERVSPGLRKSRAGVPRAERARRDRGNLLMSWRRVVLAFTITFVSALVVFTLPRFVFNTVRGATVQTPAQDTAKAQQAPPALPQPAPAPRSLGSRLTGIFGLILILGIGIALS